jgi:hypothetical protein
VRVGITFATNKALLTDRSGGDGLSSQLGKGVIVFFNNITRHYLLSCEYSVMSERTLLTFASPLFR